MTTCLRDKLAAQSSFASTPVADSSEGYVRLVDAHGNYLGYTADGRVVLYAADAPDLDTQLISFLPVVRLAAAAQVAEFVTFQTASGSGYITVPTGPTAPVEIVSQTSAGSLLRTNIYQYCY